MPTIADYTELDLTGMEIGAIEWKGERLTADFGSGYGASAVVGHASGVWGWEIMSDCLPDDDAYQNLITGLPRFQYYFNFIKDHITGSNDIFEIDFRGRKFHASFVENSISGEMLTYDVFSLAGIRLKMRRVPGIYYRSDGSVFHPTELSSYFWGWYGVDGGESLGIDLNGEHDLTVNGNVGTGTAQNGLQTMGFNVGATNTGYLNTTEDPVIKNAFFAMKMREATFSNFAGILTADTGIAMATGDSGTAKFYDQLITGLSYRKNAVDFLNSNQQAPMNTFGLAAWRTASGVGLTNLQIGKDRASTTRYAEMDVGEIILCDVLLPSTDQVDLENYLINKWGIS